MSDTESESLHVKLAMTEISQTLSNSLSFEIVGGDSSTLGSGNFSHFLVHIFVIFVVEIKFYLLVFFEPSFDSTAFFVRVEQRFR